MIQKFQSSMLDGRCERIATECGTGLMDLEAAIGGSTSSPCCTGSLLSLSRSGVLQDTGPGRSGLNRANSNPRQFMPQAPILCGMIIAGCSFFRPRIFLLTHTLAVEPRRLDIPAERFETPHLV